MIHSGCGLTSMEHRQDSACKANSLTLNGPVYSLRLQLCSPGTPPNVYRLSSWWTGQQRASIATGCDV